MALRPYESFRIGPSATRPKKLLKSIAAFEDDDEDATAAGKSPTHIAQATGRVGSSITEENKAAAAKWVDQGSTFAEQGDTAAALRCWDQALLVSNSVMLQLWVASLCQLLVLADVAAQTATLAQVHLLSDPLVPTDPPR